MSDRQEETTNRAPNYDVEIDADELLADIAEAAADYAREHEEKRQWWHESLDTVDEWHEARYWMLEALGGMRALSLAIAALQPETHSYMVDNYRNDDGTVDVRAYMRWLGKVSEEAHETSHGPYQDTRQADEAETAYCSVMTMLRDDYEVGWPRLGDVGGTPLEADMP